MNVKSEANGFHFDANPQTFLEMIPSAAIIWSSPATIYALNDSAKRLSGCSESDLAADSEFWSKHVYCRDRHIFADRQKKMEAGFSEITCNYRFCPKGLSEPIRIREMVFSLRDQTGSWKWISIYRDISDLKQSFPEGHDALIREEIREFIGCLFHEIKNRLHLLSMELELSAFEPEEKLDTKKFASALHELNRSIKELHDCIIPSRNGLLSRD